MKNLPFKSLLIYFSFFLSAASYAQTEKIDALKRTFEQYRDSAFQEKLFVHTDRDFYLTGEICWFRIFAVDGTLHQPAAVSKVAYVEILDKNQKPVLQSKIELTKGGGEGSLFIPATINSGNYIIRAYTQWMRNYHTAYFFQKAITVVNPFIRPEFDAQAVIPAPVVDFFPEGGNLVAGLRSKVAFKISNIDISNDVSLILTSGTDTVVNARPLKFGIGHFFVTPKSDQSFKSYLKTAGRVVEVKNFPKVFAEGYTMQVMDSARDIINVRARSNFDHSTSIVYAYLFVHSRNRIVKAEAKPYANGQTQFIIDKSSLPDGVTHLTLFDEGMHPMCERLYFKRPSRNLEVTVKPDQTRYTSRRKVSLDVASAYKGKAVPADIAVAVYRVDSLSAWDQLDINSYLNLASDLAGYIDSPGFYFSDDPHVSEATDNLMLTHGWRRFDWEKVKSKATEFNFIPEYRSHHVTGKVLNAKGVPTPGILTYLSSPGKLVNLYTARSNRRGEVQFEVRDFWGSRQLIMQTNSEIDSIYTLSINSSYDARPGVFSLPKFVLEPEIKEELNKRSLSMQVQDIFYRDEYNRSSSVKSDSTGFFGRPDETYNLDAYTRFPVMEEVMREYVPGVMVRKRRGGFHFIMINKVEKGVLAGDPMILMDGVPVFDVDKVMAFDPLNVKRLDVVGRTFYVGPASLSGIVSYSTYTGDLAGFEIDPRSVRVNFEGLQSQREFYAPRYDNQKERSTRLPDQRHLLHWTPRLQTDALGKATINFFTSDVPGNYMIEIQGLSKHGAAGCGSATFQVKLSDF